MVESPEYVTCAACGVRIGPEFENKEAFKEPFGDETVCEACFSSLWRRGLTVYRSLVIDGKIRPKVERQPRKRGRKPKTLLLSFANAATPGDLH